MKNIIAILLLFCLYSCDYSKYEVILDQAEQMLNKHPDSSYMLLSPIYLDNLRSRQAKARFALLYSKTLDKNCIDVKDDSLARFAANYYAEKGTYLEKAAAYYYLARVYENAEDIEQSIANMTLASEFVPDDSYYLQGLIYNSLGRSCSNQFDVARSIEYNKRAVMAYKAIGNRYNYASSLSDIANSYGLLKDYDNALLNEQMAYSIYLELRDTASILSSLEGIITWEMGNKIPLQRIKQKLFNGYSEFNKSRKYPLSYWLLSEIYTEEGKIDSVVYYLKQNLRVQDTITHLNKFSYYYKLSDIEVIQGDYRKAHKYNRKACAFATSFYLKNLNKTTQELTEKYKSALYKESLAKLEREKRYFSYILLLSFALFLSLIYMLITRHRSRLKSMDIAMSVTQDLLQTLSSSKAAIEEQYNNIKAKNTPNTENHHDSVTLENLNFVMSKFNDLIEKVPQYEKKPRKFIAEFVTLMHSTERVDSKTLLYDIVNRQYNGGLDYVKNRYGLGQYEIDLLGMICMGFSNSAMRILFNHTNDRTIYNYRSSVKTKLGISINREDIITLLNRPRE